MNSKEFIKAVEKLEKEKGIDREIIFEAMEASLMAAYKRNFKSLTNSKVTIDRKTGDIKHPDKDLIFSDKYDPRPNHIRNLKHPTNDVGVKVFKFFKDDNVYYQDNDVGELVRNYLMFCQSEMKL